MKPAQSLNVIVDISGSMGEMAKLLLCRNLVSATRDMLAWNIDQFPATSMQLINWNESVKNIEMESNQDIPFFIASGKVDVSSLIQHLEQEKARLGDQRLKSILLSDGNFSHKSSRDLKKWIDGHIDDLDFWFIEIGVDATLHTFEHVFLAEDIATTIPALLSKTGQPPPPQPAMSGDLLFTVINNVQVS